MLSQALRGESEVPGKETLPREAGESFLDADPSGGRSGRGFAYSCLHSMSFILPFIMGNFSQFRKSENTITSFHQPIWFHLSSVPLPQEPPIHTIRHCFEANSRYHIISSENASESDACGCVCVYDCFQI